MKNIKLAIALGLFLTLGACASAPDTLQTRYVLTPSGDITTQQYMVPGNDTGNKVLETVAIVGLGIVGLYFVGEVFDLWDNNNNDTPAPQQSPLIATGGQTSWSTDYVQPVYQPVNSQIVQIQPTAFAE